jgi:UDP-N-acetylmuramoyl-L-alanyl-D-glutamate--2,6-diaminopimelate ligase
MALNLRTLFNDSTVPDIIISGLSLDSRTVAKGDLFAALSGSKNDGGAFIDQAIANGAVAILGGLATPQYSVPVVRVENPRAMLAIIAAQFYPQQPENIVAVTGTNGKTSVAEMCRQLWQLLGIKSASLGTLGVLMDWYSFETGMTSPDVLSFQRMLADVAERGCTTLAFEASSHALDQYRVHGAHISVAGFTNLTRDHLDYHKTLENYGAAKAKLFFEVLPQGGTAVLNMDDPFGAALATECEKRHIKVIRYGQYGVELKLMARDILLQGQHLRVLWSGQRIDILMPLVGAFQTANALCAAAMIIASGQEPVKVFSALSKLKSIPGRLEQVGVTHFGASVYVDYAHTPDGLRAALEALRPHTQAKLHIVFGCGGDRDRGKRPEMAKIAAKLADSVIITDDNPRTEDPEAIRAEVAVGAPSATLIGDRKKAISEAMRTAGAGDIILIAGKGHETGQIIGTVVYPFNDGDVVRDLVQENAA